MAVTSGTDDLGDYVHLEPDLPNKTGILLRRTTSGPSMVTLYQGDPSRPRAVLGLDPSGIGNLTLYDDDTAAVLTADSLARLLGLLNSSGVVPPPTTPPTTPPPTTLPEPPPDPEQLPTKRKK